MKNKPILCFHIGYIPDINIPSIKTTYGSEIALIKISSIFSKKYRVIIFGDCLSNIIINDIEYLNSSYFENFQKSNEIEIIILLRYIFPLIDFELNAKKIFLWCQDIYAMHYYQNLALPNYGKELLKNMIHKIDGIITLTNWHKNYLEKFYEINQNKVFVIGNAIDDKMFEDNFNKQKNKFIWTSHGYRGINKLIEYFHEIRNNISDAELYIYRDETAFDPEIFKEFFKYDYIHYGGKLNNNEIIKEFENSEFWFYPTDFEETYCISALEAQMAKCVCVCSDLAGLSETVGERGVLIKEPIWSKEYKEKAINEITKISNDTDIKKQYQESGYEWAKNQTWKNRAEEWYKLFRT